MSLNDITLSGLAGYFNAVLPFVRTNYPTPLDRAKLWHVIFTLNDSTGARACT
jgi:hypothetical protein